MNQALKEFTFILTTITVVGPIVLYFLKGKNKYATEYFQWLHAVDKKIDAIIDSLSEDQKKKLFTYATKYANEGAKWITHQLVLTGIKPKIAKTIVLAGSTKVKNIVKNKLKIEE